ncbi:MAG: DUF305 domain-containing protein [Oscillatoriales cyanobacterium]|nr:MAG: DUF305 domain-containing protein [Oscillatoriales cyanobacterium]
MFHQSSRLIALMALTTIAFGTGLTACNQPQDKDIAVVETPMDDMVMDHGEEHGMDLGPADPQFDLRFIDAMIPHHEGAVIMAEAALKHSKRPEIQALAKAIIAAQTVEIQQMRDWRAAWYADADDRPMAYHAEMGHMMPMSEAQIEAMKMSVDLGAGDEGFDLRFIEAMIPHHQGAIAMAKDVLTKTERPDVRTLAEAILSSQAQEIAQMEAWRQAWYGK